MKILIVNSHSGDYYDCGCETPSQCYLVDDDFDKQETYRKYLKKIESLKEDAKSNPENITKKGLLKILVERKILKENTYIQYLIKNYGIKEVPFIQC